MIEAFVGVPGSGKSYALVIKGLEALKAGRRVYANFGLIPERVYLWLRRRARLSHRDAVLRADMIREIRDYAELLNVHDGVLLFDEAHMWLPSRQFDLIPVEVIAFWSQHRKVGVDVYLATQRYGSVDAIVRELVANVFWARPAPFWLRLLLRPWARGRPVLRYTAIMDESLGIMQRTTRGVFEGVARNSIVILDPLAASCYDTHAIFEPPIVRLQRELDPKRRAIMDRMGLRWDASRLQGRFRPSDGLPFLSMRELADAYRRGVPPHEVLREKWGDVVSSHESAPPHALNRSPLDPVPSLSADEEAFDWSRVSWSG
ncbi:zonular occludens toxin domain-containing protein [Thermus caldifontis]|uniref:zonular occludens toxin domain-containing protein n=1 Tax=Thermus caldifontis TaxID=1930763 RepID=UPI000DF28A60|nr:zonular occludens toxin domain-containing protein [Thermus caldifontis]